jgi:hypothetical protein
MAFGSFERQVRERVEALLDGTAQDTLTGATSVRCAVGLVVRNLDGLTTLDEDSAWDYLDRGNRDLVHTLRDVYADRLRGWEPMPRRESQLIAVRGLQTRAQQDLLRAVRHGRLYGDLSETTQEALEELRALIREEQDLDPVAFRNEVFPDGVVL